MMLMLTKCRASQICSPVSERQPALGWGQQGEQAGPDPAPAPCSQLHPASPVMGTQAWLSHGVLSPSPGPRGSPQLPRCPQLWEGQGTELPSQMVRGLFFSLKHLKYEKKAKKKRKAKHQLLGNPLVFLPPGSPHSQTNPSAPLPAASSLWHRCGQS